MYSRLTIVFCIWILVGCSPAETILPTATVSPYCGDWQASDNNFTCIAIDDALLIQSGVEQITLQAYEASIVIYGTIAIIAEDSLRIAILEGNAIIGAQGQTRIVQTGREITLNIVDNHAEAPSDIRYIDTLPNNLTIQDLPRPLESSNYMIIPPESPIVILTIPENDCPAPDGWVEAYTVEAGDTLARVANRYDLTIEALAEGNCLSNVARIIIGQELAVPVSRSTLSTPSPISISFRADAYSLESGNCTILRWDALEVESIFLDDESISASSSQEICPKTTTSYNLRVVLSENQEETRELTISVQE